MRAALLTPIPRTSDQESLISIDDAFDGAEVTEQAMRQYRELMGESVMALLPGA